MVDTEEVQEVKIFSIKWSTFKVKNLQSGGGGGYGGSSGGSSYGGSSGGGGGYGGGSSGGSSGGYGGSSGGIFNLSNFFFN